MLALTPEDDPGAVPALPHVMAGWRIEVTRRGRYWQWRRGRASHRQSRYGGRFDQLPLQRQEQYERNKERRKAILADHTG